MVLSSETKRSGVRIRATSMYASIATCMVLAGSLVMYASLHVLHTSSSSNRPPDGFPRRLNIDVSAAAVSAVVKPSFRIPKASKKKILAQVIVIDQDSTSSDDSGDDDDDDGDSSSPMQKLLDRIALPPVISNQANLFRNVRDEYEKSLTVSETENKDIYLPVYDRLYKEAPGIFSFSDHDGTEMMDSIIKALCADPKRETVTVMEVGVWFGNSLARRLKLDPKVLLVGVDPFVAVPTQPGQVSLLRPHEKKLFGKVKFNRGLLLHNIREQLHVEEPTDRTLAVAGFFPQGVDFLFEAHRKQQAPDIDIFYIDAGMVSDTREHLDFVTSITKVMQEFPNVIVFGDDWKHGTYYNEFQETIRELAAIHGRAIFLSENRAWVMAKLKAEDS
eukprot:scaffold2294_cov106-Cylindrotheca_fusiformis.AAC.9